MANATATFGTRFGNISFTHDQRNSHQNDGCATIYNNQRMSMEETKIVGYDSGNHILQATKFNMKVGPVNSW
jgi:hypothetical protein